jgi:hypothetical protein
MSYDTLPHDDFAAGFEVGYRAVKGTAAGLPGTPGQPGTRGNMTAFLMGVRKGLERAGGDLDKR